MCNTNLHDINGSITLTTGHVWQNNSIYRTSCKGKHTCFMVFK